MTKLATNIRTWPSSLVGLNLVWYTGYCDWKCSRLTSFPGTNTVILSRLGYIAFLSCPCHLPIWQLDSYIARGSRQIYHRIEDKEMWVAHKGFAEDQSSGMLLLRRRYCAEVSKVLVLSSSGSGSPRRNAWPSSLTELNFCSSLSDTNYLLWLW